MKPTESATKILNVLRKGTRFKVLNNLAKEAGFVGANRKDFKKGLNYLIRNEILKVEQSGWSSEKRGRKHHHPKGVILLGNIYVLGELEEEEETETKRPVGEVHDIPNSPYSKSDPSDELVEIHALGGDGSYITQSEYEKSKDGINFWTHTHILTK